MGLCMALCSIEDSFLLFPDQIRQRVHQILNMRGSSIKIVRHILKGELRYSCTCRSVPGAVWSSLCRMSLHTSFSLTSGASLSSGYVVRSDQG